MKSSRLLLAAPGPQYWNRPVVPKAPAPAAVAPATIAPTPAALTATTCGTCECCKKAS